MYNLRYYAQHGSTVTCFESNLPAAIDYWAITPGAVLVYRRCHDLERLMKKLDCEVGIFRVEQGLIEQYLENKAEMNL